MMKRILLLSVLLIVTSQVFAQDVKYYDANGKPQTASSGSYTAITDQTTELTTGWYVVNSNVTTNSRITVSGTVHLILTDGYTLTANSGVYLDMGNELNIYGQADCTGTLTAKGGPNEAGIGSNIHGNGGKLVVNGGTVNATAGYSAAGIGGGAQGYWAGTYGNGGTVIINGGKVTATGDGCGAGIGGGGDYKHNTTAIPGRGGTVIINGGQVTATSPDGYGIGPGTDPSKLDGEMGTLQLGWRNNTDRIYMSSVKATVTLNSDFVYEDTKEPVNANELNGLAIVPSGSNPKVKGDVNEDGNVDINDVVAVINVMAGTAGWSNADVNGDGSTDINDVVAIINIMANGGGNDDPIPVDPDAAVVAGLCPDNHHPHAIDIGNGIKFACCNIGASAPWERGGMYAWGETEEKTQYTEENYKYSVNNEFQELGDIAGTSYDVAFTAWGSAWCMPNSTQMEYLCDEKNKGEWTTLNGFLGVMFKTSNGASLFLPATGVFNDEGLIWEDVAAYYWSSTPADYLAGWLEIIKPNMLRYSYGYRPYGLCVRAVAK